MSFFFDFAWIASIFGGNSEQKLNLSPGGIELLCVKLKMSAQTIYAQVAFQLKVLATNRAAPDVGET